MSALLLDTILPSSPEEDASELEELMFPFFTVGELFIAVCGQPAEDLGGKLPATIPS